MRFFWRSDIHGAIILRITIHFKLSYDAVFFPIFVEYTTISYCPRDMPQHVFDKFWQDASLLFQIARKLTMTPKSKKQKAGAKSYADTRGDRRTRLIESTHVEHLHIELFRQGGRIEKLRANLKNKKQDESALR